MAGWTNRGKYLFLGYAFRNATRPTAWQAFLGLATPTPTADSNLKSDVAEIATGNGYTANGIALSLNATDFDVYTEDDTNDRALIQARDLTWTASGGSLPASGNGARYLYLADATGAGGQVVSFHDLAADRSVSVGQNLTIQDAEWRLTE